MSSSVLKTVVLLHFCVELFQGSYISLKEQYLAKTEIFCNKCLYFYKKILKWIM